MTLGGLESTPYARATGYTAFAAIALYLVGLWAISPPRDAGEDALFALLVFEPPLENIEYLHLELPAAACGMTGTLYLQIPKGMIRR